jgi:eukaryotic translation initiation factor 2C
MGSKMIAVHARILPVPTITYQASNLSRKRVEVDTKSPGKWNMTDSMNFSSPGPKGLGKWTYLKVERDITSKFSDASLHPALTEFTKVMRKRGITDARFPVQGPWTSLNFAPYESFEDRLKNWFDKRKVEGINLVLVILPGREKDVELYTHIKKVADRRSGISTVCVLEQKFADKNDQYLTNVALKVNLKIGGQNQALGISTSDCPDLGIIAEGKTMVVGLDVTHPSPGSGNQAPSVAGIVASIDKELGQWPAELRIQIKTPNDVKKSKEMITGLRGMLKSRIMLWEEHNGERPENIIVYRDGVSEGQYQQVLDKELEDMQQACKDVGRHYMAKFSIIVVGKRHHTRFFPTKKEDGDSNGNPKPGTVVDRGITEARNWDFFLQAHAGLNQGSTRPAHYYVVLDEIFVKAADKRRKDFEAEREKQKMSREQDDENDWHQVWTRKGKQKAGAPNAGETKYDYNMGSAADDLEQLTHNLCYLFGRATKAVSVCPPAYYADLVCDRARFYLSKYYNSSLDQARIPTDGDVQVHPDIRNTMFYI